MPTTHSGACSSRRGRSGRLAAPIARRLAHFLLAASLAGLWGCGGSEEKNGAASKPQETPASQPSTMLGELNLETYDRNGARTSRVKARELKMTSAEDKYFLDGVLITQYDQEKEISWIRSDRGVLYRVPIFSEGMEKDDMFLDGNVRFRRQDGFDLSTPSAVYKSRIQRLSSDRETDVLAPFGLGKAWGHGKGFDLDINSNLKDLRLTLRRGPERQVKFQIRGKDARPSEKIASETLERSAGGSDR